MPPVDIAGVDFVLDDRPDLHQVLAGLRSRRDYAIVPFVGTRALLLLTRELVAAGFRDEETCHELATTRARVLDSVMP